MSAAIRLPTNRDLYYGGAWHAPRGGHAETLDPATGESLGLAPVANADDVAAAVAAAKAAFPAWRDATPGARAKVLRDLAALIREHADELALIDAANGGNPVTLLRADMGFAAGQLEYFAGLAGEAKGDTLPGGAGALTLTMREPLGVVARIVAFNHPLMFLAAKFAAAAAAGNTLVMKAAEAAPLSALRLMELAQGAIPPGVLNVVCGGPDCGQALVKHPDVAMVTLIGGIGTGRAVARDAGEGLKPVLLELGGKNALVVYPDADLEAAAQAAVRGMAFGWCGQSCGSTSRFFVHEAVHDRVLARVVELAAAFTPGPPAQDATTMGALTSEAHLQRVLQHIETAKSEGARIALGGERPGAADLRRGAFLPPTILADVTPAMRIAREEVFGPVLSVLRWSDADDVIGHVNALPYGLTAAVFTRDLAVAHRAARNIQAGAVAINGVGFHGPGAPFGGYKASGLGREECLDELLAFTQTKTLHVNF